MQIISKINTFQKFYEDFTYHQPLIYKYIFKKKRHIHLRNARLNKSVSAEKQLQKTVKRIRIQYSELLKNE